MGKQKPDFTKTSKNPFMHNMAAAAEFLGPLPSANPTESESEPTIEPEATPNPTTEPIQAKDTTSETKKTREARDKENGKQHIHIILPKYQADALKRMSKSYGMTVTEFMQETIEMHLNGDWKARLELMQLNQRKLEFVKENFAGIEPINK